MIRLLACAAIACAVAAPAHAGPPKVGPAELYHQGEEDFRAGRIQEAIDAFTKGYALEPRPEFLLNLAQCYRALGRRAEAISYYERFIAAAPDHPMRPAAERTLSELRSAEAVEHVEARRTAPPAPVPPPPPPPPPRRSSHAALWISGGVVAVAAGAAAIYFATRRDGFTDTVHLPPP